MSRKTETYTTTKWVLYYPKFLEMKKKGLTVPQIAKEIPVHRATLYRWERKELLLGAQGESSTMAKKQTIKTSKEPKTTSEKPKTASNDVSSQELTKLNRSLQAQLEKSQEECRILSGFIEKSQPGTTSSIVEEMAKEIRYLNKKLIEQSIKEEASTCEETGDVAATSVSTVEPNKVVKELRKQLKFESMKADAYSKMIDIAEETLGVNIRKKPGAKQ